MPAAIVAIASSVVGIAGNAGASCREVEVAQHIVCSAEQHLTGKILDFQLVGCQEVGVGGCDNDGNFFVQRDHVQIVVVRDGKAHDGGVERGEFFTLRCYGDGHELK